MMLNCALSKYCFRIPENYPLALAAPLPCAGITVYTQMVRHKMNQPGKSLGVIGLGGLGHVAIKLGKAFGLKFVVFSTSISKKEEALSLLGADQEQMKANGKIWNYQYFGSMEAMAKSLDFIIDTASADHLFDPYMSLLKMGSSIGMKTVLGSATGGMKYIQEMIDLCAAQHIHQEIEVIPIDYANEALEGLIKRDVKYRFVINIENSLK
ncbi:hypothetical protein EUGRSUZ_L01278 [Eucalyptus grandis]|uniref:cinnamyl-alcohol dehydrogenase n=1 Tax=Eucalyptus grandis TaxID=71139 RepID=A0A058ZUI2_EUCGR|nr:hypothetical protein EUGRSUZ_L01278 [Eucalyptus grandis]